MRYIVLLIAVAIIYIAVSRMGSEKPNKEMSVTENMAPADATPAPVPGAAPANSIKAPLDRARAVIDQARKQNSGEQF